MYRLRYIYPPGIYSRLVIQQPILYSPADYLLDQHFHAPLVTDCSQIHAQVQLSHVTAHHIVLTYYDKKINHQI